MSSCSGFSTISTRPRRWSRATAAASTAWPISKARRSACRLCRRRISSCSTRCSRPGLKPSDAQDPQHAPARNRRGVERGDIDATFIWDPVLSKREEDRQGADDLRRHLQEGQVHLRRPDRDREVRARRTPSSWSRLVKVAGQGRCRLSRQSQGGVDRRSGQGGGGGEVFGRQAGGGGRPAMALYGFPSAGGAGLARVAGRRRQRRGDQGARAAGATS